MSNLTPQSPLMQPVAWQGQDYFSSQYFHAQYLANSQHGGKYRRHGDFLRVLRNIEAYKTYVEQDDIVELDWPRMKSEGTQNLLSFQPLFQAAGWNPLTLLNATAQLALAHHLDDEISKQMSVAANTTIARQSTRKHLAVSTPLELASRDMAAWMDAARIFATPVHIAQQEGVKMIASLHGIDFHPLLVTAPAQNKIEPEEEMLEPTDLAQRLGYPSGVYMNQVLAQCGLQVKQIGGNWIPTPTGQPHASRHAWTRGPKHGYNLRWKVEAIAAILHARGIVPPPEAPEAPEAPSDQGTLL